MADFVGDYRQQLKKRKNSLRDLSFITSQGGGGFGGGGGVQCLKRVNLGGSVLKMYKV